MTRSNALQANSLINFDASTLSGTYQLVGTVGDGGAVVFKVYNSGASLVFLSLDGTNDHDFVPPGSAYVIDCEANAEGWQGMEGHKSVRPGQRIWAKTSSNTDRLVFATYH